MLIRYFIILLAFFYGMILGKYQVFPYDELRYAKHFITYAYKSIDFNRNVKCVENINSSFNVKDQISDYTFFIAGHTYSNNSALNEAFYLDLLNSKEKFSFGILAGDVVKKNTENSWSFLQKQIGNLDYKIYISPGNHDINSVPLIDIEPGDVGGGGREFIENKYGKTYYKFIKNKDLFIILDSNNTNQSILDKQLDFFKKTLNENYKTVKNIFIISHNMIYYDKNREPFSKARPNSDIASNQEIDSNFWPTIYPILENLNNNIFIISGDTGWALGKELFCHKSRNITFLATGMAGAIPQSGVGRSKHNLFFDKHYLIFDSINQIIKIRVRVI